MLRNLSSGLLRASFTNSSQFQLPGNSIALLIFPPTYLTCCYVKQENNVEIQIIIISRFCLNSFINFISLIGLRLLFTAEALGLDGYKESKSRMAQQYSSPQMKEKFCSRIHDFMNTDENNLIFTDDLKTMLMLAEDKPEDIALLNKMIER